MGDKAYFQVQAGLIPGEPDPLLSRIWTYTSADFEQDLVNPAGQGGLSIFATKMLEASHYSLGLIDPAARNWVTLDWIWL